MQGKALPHLPFPAVCTPLVARTQDALVIEAKKIATLRPDLLEWRVDFFSAIADTQAVLAAGKAIREAGNLPLLFTRRHSREGGEQIPVSDDQVVALYRAVCEAGFAGLVDFEMDNEPHHLDSVREYSRAAGLPLVLSFHDFGGTPSPETLAARFAKAQALGGDAAKIAVMPKSMADVLTLLDATLKASKELSIPVVSMAMGALGGVSRMCGGAFGSAMTFAVGDKPSAPGQMPIADVQAAIDMLRRAYRG